LQAYTSTGTSKSSVCISCLDMRPYTDHHVKAVSLATAEICVESRGGVGVHRKDGREQSIVIGKRAHRQTWLRRENRLCTHCSNRVVEDEFLFLTECNKYNNIRGNLLLKNRRYLLWVYKNEKRRKTTPRRNNA